MFKRRRGAAAMAEQLAQVLALLRGEKDEQKFVGLLLVTKYDPLPPPQ